MASGYKLILSRIHDKTPDPIHGSAGCLSATSTSRLYGQLATAAVFGEPALLLDLGDYVGYELAASGLLRGKGEGQRAKRGTLGV